MSSHSIGEGKKLVVKEKMTNEKNHVRWQNIYFFILLISHKSSLWNKTYVLLVDLDKSLIYWYTSVFYILNRSTIGDNGFIGAIRSNSYTNILYIFNFIMFISFPIRHLLSPRQSLMWTFRNQNGSHYLKAKWSWLLL